jgi:hypothetical protein
MMETVRRRSAAWIGPNTPEGPQELGPAARPEDGIGYPGRVQENRAAETLRPCWRGLDEY